MLKNITWVVYWIAILMIFIGYYVIICLRYYKGEIKDILSGKRSLLQKTNLGSRSQRMQIKLTEYETNEGDLLPAVNQLAAEIKYLLEEATANKMIKQEALYSLQQLAKKYFQIKGSPFQSFITNYILVESSNYSSIHLSEEDLKTLWLM